MPVLSLVFGVRDAVPVLTVAQLVGNASRVWPNRREVSAGRRLVRGRKRAAGRLTAPFFLAFGLKGAYIGTEAATAVVTHAAKIAVYGTAALVTAKGVGTGLFLGAVMVAGTYLGKRLVDRVSERAFVLVVEAVLVAAGLYFLAAG